MDQIRKIVREELLKEMLKSDNNKLDHIRSILEKKYADNPQMLERVNAFISMEKIDPEFSIKSLINHLKIFMGVELS